MNITFNFQIENFIIIIINLIKIITVIIIFIYYLLNIFFLDINLKIIYFFLWDLL